MKSRSRTLSAHIIPLLSIGLLATFFRPAQAQAYQRCDSLTTLAYQAFEAHQAGTEDLLEGIAATATAAELCYNEQRTSRRIWLRGLRVWAHDELGRFRQAHRLVDDFFGALVDAADAETRARMLRYQVRFLSFQGDGAGAIAALDRLTPFMDSLSTDDQLHIRLTRASVNLDMLRLDRSLSILANVFEEIEYDATPDFALARALHVRGEARLEKLLETERSADGTDDQWFDLGAVEEDLLQAADLFDRLEIPDRQGRVLATLGEIAAWEGNAERSEVYIQQALSLLAHTRHEILFTFRHGRARMAAGDYAAAEVAFERGRALSDSIGYYKYSTDLDYELAGLFELRLDLAEAHRRFDELARSELYYGEGALRGVVLLEASEERAGDLSRVLLLRERNLILGALILVLLTAGFVVSMVVTWSRRRLVREQWRRAFLGRVYDEMILHYVQEVICNPQQVAKQIQVNALLRSRRLARDRLRGIMELYQCVADLYYVVQGEELTVHAVRHRIRRAFNRKGWERPDSIEAWRQFFEDHPAA